MAVPSPDRIKFDSSFPSIHTDFLLFLFQETTSNTLATMVTFRLPIARVVRCHVQPYGGEVSNPDPRRYSLITTTTCASPRPSER